MKGLFRWWQSVGARPMRWGWGLAPQGQSWSLMGLQRQNEVLAKVQNTQALQPPTLQSASRDHGNDLRWLSHALRQIGAASNGAGQRLNMALPLTGLASGQIEFPAQLSEDEWQAEVQLEASQSLGLEPDEVNFDFQPEPDSGALVRRVHWVACAKTLIAEFKTCTRAAGWRLVTVEPELHAARRAAGALQGGLHSMLTQPVQDWQFRLSSDPAGTRTVAPTDAALLQAMASPLGPRLVAAGLALKAWS